MKLRGRRLPGDLQGTSEAGNERNNERIGRRELDRLLRTYLKGTVEKQQPNLKEMQHLTITDYFEILAVSCFIIIRTLGILLHLLFWCAISIK